MEQGRASDWSLALALAVAVVTRVQQLGEQILVGDEWHALERAATCSAREIATTLGNADHSIPISLAYRVLAQTVGLTETAIRAPFLVAGLVTVAGGAWLARRVAGRGTAAVLAWLLAVSPILVLYSRHARPYAITCLLASVALLAFEAWWQHGRRRAAVAYVASVGLAGWMHMAVLPFALVPFALRGALALGKRGDARRTDLLRLLGLGLATGTALAVLLVPPVLLDAEGMGRKLGWGRPSPLALWRATTFLIGSSSGAVSVVLIAAACAGTVRLLRERRAAALTFLCAGAAQVGALLVLTPAPRTDTFALARYLLPLLPPFLFAAAAGIAAPFRGRVGTAGAVGALAGIVLLALGPIPATFRRPDGWVANELTLGILGRSEDHVARVHRIPDFYASLAARPPGSVTLVEAPWQSPVDTNPLSVYQAVHRQHTRIGFTNGLTPTSVAIAQLPSPAPGFHLANFLFLETLLGPAEPPADYLVLHRDTRREIRIGAGPYLRDLADAAYVDIEPLVARFRERFGPPCAEDDLIVVFRLR